MNTALLDRLFQWLDLLFLFDCYEAICGLLYPGLRPLTRQEIRLLTPIFGDSLPYALIRIDERAWVGPRHYRFYYVSFHTINSWGPLTEAVLVHEAVHVWQYVHRGGCYIPRALAAQRTVMGYDYRGLRGLAAAATLDDFNYEQMADVVEDAFRLRVGLSLKWVVGRQPDPLRHYARLTEQLLVALPHPYGR